MDALTNAMDNFNALNPVIVSAVCCQCGVCHAVQLVDANEAVVNHARCTGAVCHMCGANTVKPMTKKACEKRDADAEEPCISRRSIKKEYEK